MTVDTTDDPQPPPAGFATLTLENWRQFESIRINFHPRFTVLTGANASGKSTLLGILARHFNYARGYSPEPTERSSKRRWRTLRRLRNQQYADGQLIDIGALTYGTNTSTPIRVPVNDSSENRSEYSLDLPTQQPVEGAFLPSHRLVSGNYVSIGEIPTVFADADTLFTQFDSELRVRWQSAASHRPPQYAFKQALIAAAIFGNSGNEHVEFNPLAAEIWEGFLEVLHEVMPEPIGFISIRIRMPDVIIETRTGDFIVDEASGGISAILEMAWQIFLRSRTKRKFTVLIDEPENHLHPSLQREIMPSLLRAFPGVQFIVASHSPFVVTSSPDSAVYALEFNSNGRVASRELDYANKAASADETLRKVLGVPSTLPGWAETKFDEIVQRYAQQPLDETSVSAMRNELRRNGLMTEFPEAILRATDESSGGNAPAD